MICKVHAHLFTDICVWIRINQKYATIQPYLTTSMLYLGVSKSRNRYSFVSTWAVLQIF
jgi:hypothetical protein